MLPLKQPVKQKVPLELEEHLILCDWLNKHGIWFHHSPNEAKRSVQQWVMLGRMGMKKGFPDFIIPGPTTYAIELKRCTKSKSRVSKEQTKTLGVLAGLGWKTYIAYGAADAIGWLQNCCPDLIKKPLKSIGVVRPGGLLLFTPCAAPSPTKLDMWGILATKTGYKIGVLDDGRQK